MADWEIQRDIKGVREELKANRVELVEIKHALWKLVDIAAQTSSAIVEMANYLIPDEED